jgi:hypothetical protein
LTLILYFAAPVSVYVMSEGQGFWMGPSAGNRTQVISSHRMSHFPIQVLIVIDELTHELLVPIHWENGGSLTEFHIIPNSRSLVSYANALLVTLNNRHFLMNQTSQLSSASGGSHTIQDLRYATGQSKSRFTSELNNLSTTLGDSGGNNNKTSTVNLTTLKSTVTADGGSFQLSSTGEASQIVFAWFHSSLTIGLCHQSHGNKIGHNSECLQGLSSKQTMKFWNHSLIREQPYCTTYIFWSKRQTVVNKVLPRPCVVILLCMLCKSSYPIYKIL